MGGSGLGLLSNGLGLTLWKGDMFMSCLCYGSPLPSHPLMDWLSTNSQRRGEGAGARLVCR